MRREEEAVMLAANLTFPESIIIKVWTQLFCCKDIKHSCSNPKIGNKTKLSVAGSSYKNMHLANNNIFTQLSYLKNMPFCNSQTYPTFYHVNHLSKGGLANYEKG